MFFFFQAEDGIRDFHVTGVQTCALPIYFSDDGRFPEVPIEPSRLVYEVPISSIGIGGEFLHGREVLLERRRLVWLQERRLRSEERRVGKEGRGRRAREHQKKSGDIERSL